jgi:uracil-DNA glycosylase family 4
MRGFFTGRHSSDIVQLRMNQKPSDKKEGTVGGRGVRRISTDPCERCGLHKNVTSPKMGPTGKGYRKILVIGEAPGATEDKTGVQFVGKAGTYLRTAMRKFRLNSDNDCWFINAVNCRPISEDGGNRTPENKEVKCCRSWLYAIIEQLKPQSIWLMGQIPLDSYLMDMTFNTYKISDWRGLAIPDIKLGAWVFPMFHPSYIIRKNNQPDRFAESVFYRDMVEAIKYVGKPRPVEIDYNKNIKIITNFNEALAILIDLNKKEDVVVAFDYETNCIDPRNLGAKILTVSIAYKEGLRNKAFAFPCYSDPNFRREWGNFLKNKKIKKIAHNLKFEEKWSANILGTPVVNWDWDTMIGTHLLHASRKGKGGLEFQTFTNYGIYGWDKEVDEFIQGGTNKINRLEEVPIEKLLLYNGLDSLFTIMLYQLHMKEGQRGTDNWFSRISGLFMDGLRTFGEIEHEGINIDVAYYDREKAKLTTKIDRLENKLSTSQEAMKFESVTNKKLKLKSNTDLKLLFEKIMKMQAVKITDKGQFSVDSVVLKSINSDFTQSLLQYRNLLKIRDTYLGQFYREVIDGKINPSFNLHIARSGRSSSDHPNFQNIPARDEFAAETVRRGIIPSKGFRLLDADYGSMEVRIMACASRDPALINYINNPKSDMHRDQAEKLFFLQGQEVNEELRFTAKNSFVFASFYGSWFLPCSESIWDALLTFEKNGMKVNNVPIMEHLKKKGVENLDQYSQHVEQVSNDFWDVFSATKEWGEHMVQNYLRTGFIEMPTGFRRAGLMERNKILNTPIQGAAFHCLLWSINKLAKIRKREKWQTKIIAQIHDAINYDNHPDEFKMVMERTRKVMCEDIRNEWKWIIVPLVVKFSASEVNGNWYDMEDVK